MTRAEFVSELPKIFAAMDQPTNDGVNTYFVSRAARQAGLTVVLSGLASDEAFWGYRHYLWLEGRGRWLAWCPSPAWAGQVALRPQLREGYLRRESQS